MATRSKSAVAPAQAAASIARQLGGAVNQLNFAPPVACVYNPLDYGDAAHTAYLERMVRPGIGALLVGMNPGPFGMAQTAVPFGEISHVRDWLGIRTGVGCPEHQHAKRPIWGFSCQRREVSGARLWGWAKRRFGTPESFAQAFFVWNYCPLAFLEDSGRNRTPDKLPAAERQALFGHCDRALAALVTLLGPRWVVGIGRFAEGRLRAVAANDGLPDAVEIGSILHPSPASPLANRGWEARVEEQLGAMGLDLWHSERLAQV